MKNILIISLSVAFILSACTSVAQAIQTVSPVPFNEPQQGSVTFDSSKTGSAEKEITYCQMDGVDLKMDVYYPDQYSARPWPVVMYVHGGAWQKGDKNEGAGSRAIPALRASGFLVVAVDYRLAPTYKFPAQIEDVQCAVRSLRANASRFHLDPEKIGVWGGSAGGHLVALLGTAANKPEWKVGEYLDQSSRVQAVVDMFGPADLSVEFDTSNFQTARVVFGARNGSDPKLINASPVNYVDSTDAPFLILHGDQDNVVPLEQSQLLFKQLQQYGVESKLVIVQGAGHGFVRAGDQPINPGLSEINRQIVEFFIKHLKG
jgi:acetyl esterase/lipase